MKKILFLTLTPLLILLSYFTLTQAACLPCDPYDALCGLDCACTTSTGACGYQDSTPTDPGLNCTSPYIANSTQTACICGNEACCQNVFGPGAIWNGNDTDGCTCSPESTWNGSQCVLNECGLDYIRHDNGTCICGDASCCQRIFGPGAIWDGNGTDGCTCSPESTWDGSQCVLTDEIIYSASFFDTTTPLVANGSSQGHISVTLKSKNTGSLIPATFSIDYSTVSQPGSVTVTMTEGDTYYLTYTAPNLSATSTSTAKDILYIHYTDPNTGSAAYKTFEIPLTAGINVRVTKPGFKDATSRVIFGSDSAKVRVVAGASKTPVSSANIFLPSDPTPVTTDSLGLAYLSGSGAGNTIPETVITLYLDDEFSSLRRDGQSNYREIGIKKRTVYNFITNIDNLLAQETTPEGVQKIKNGLRRTVYALFFIKEAKEIGYDTSSELAASLSGALADLNDLFDFTGRITDRLLSSSGKYIEKYADTTALTNLSKSFEQKLKNASQTLFKKSLRLFSYGVARFARDFPQSWLTGTFEDLKTNLFNDYLYSPASSALSIQEIVKKSMQKNVDSKMYSLLSRVESNISSRSWGTNDINSDLSRAKQNYVNLMDSYLTAHEVNYNVTIQKAAAESLLQAANDTIGLIPAYGKYVEGIETAYKAIRSAYLNNRQIYYWFDITGKVMTETDKNVSYALGNSLATLPNNLQASAAPLTDSQYNDLLAYEEANIDAEFYNSFLLLAQEMQSLNPDDPELNTLVSDLSQKTSTASSTAVSLSESLGNQTIAEFNASRTAPSYNFEYDTNVPITSNTESSCFSDTSSSPHETAICYVKNRGIVEGYSDGTYKPDQPINRAEFTKIIIAATYESSAITGSSCFSDVNSEWFAPYVCAARTLGVVNGNPDGTFRPANNINLAESLKIILEAAASQANFEIPETGGQWYQKYLSLALSLGLLNNIDQNPSHALTRGEMAEIVYQSENLE